MWLKVSSFHSFFQFLPAWYSSRLSSHFAVDVGLAKLAARDAYKNSEEGKAAITEAARQTALFWGGSIHLGPESENTLTDSILELLHS